MTCLLGSLGAGCSDQKPHTAIQLHFKSPQQVKNVLDHLAEDTSGYEISGRTLLASPEAENLETVLTVIKQIDKPPQAYQLKLTTQNTKYIKNYSTDTTNKIILLTEGLRSTVRINKTPIDILIIRASESSSLMEVISYEEVEEKKVFESGTITKVLDQKHNWIINHGQNNNLASDIFKNGFILLVK